jgi:hypothetical protein
MSGLYTSCDVNKFFDAMTTLFSSEGISSMMARGAGAYLFSYNEFKKVKADPKSSSFAIGVAFGNLFGAVTNYHI